MTDAYRTQVRRWAEHYNQLTANWLARRPPYPAEVLAALKTGRLSLEDAAQRWRIVDKLAGFQAAETHLDIGCGTNWLWLPQLRQAGTRYVGLDISLAALAAIQQHAPADHVALTLGRGDGLPFVRGYFNVITVIGLSEHWPAPYLEILLRQVKQVLAPGGRLIIDFLDGVTDGAGHSQWLANQLGLPCYTLTYTDIEALLQAVGLQSVRILSTGRRQVHRVI